MNDPAHKTRVVGLGEGSEDQETGGNCQGALEFHKVEPEQNNSATLTAGRAPRRIVPPAGIAQISAGPFQFESKYQPGHQ